MCIFIISFMGCSTVLVLQPVKIQKGVIYVRKDDWFMDNGVLTLSGIEFTDSEVSLVKEIAEMYPKLTRAELIETICENMVIFSPGGRGKKHLCTKLLERLEADGVIKLKHRKNRKPRKTKDKK